MRPPISIPLRPRQLWLVRVGFGRRRVVGSKDSLEFMGDPSRSALCPLCGGHHGGPDP